METPGVGGIVLAAGRSARMGRLKQLLPMGERTLIEVVVERVCSRLERVVVVVGYRAAEIARVLKPYPVECARNPDYGRGMLSSVQCGIERAGEVSGYLICLGDQPGVEAQTMGRVLDAAAGTDRGIVIPTWEGRRGHPIFISRRYAGEIRSLSLDRGLNVVTRGHPRDTLELPLKGAEIVEDMDTPADYRRQLERLQFREGQQPWTIS